MWGKPGCEAMAGAAGQLFVQRPANMGIIWHHRWRSGPLFCANIADDPQ
jgi:hypothetical protein